MKEHPVTFSAPMIRAIREDRKTQMRRIIKPTGKDEGFLMVEQDDGFLWPYRSYDGEALDDGKGCEVPLNAPYGGPCDIIWCRETWRLNQGAFAPEAIWNEVGVDYLADGQTIWYDCDILGLWPYGDKDADPKTWLPKREPPYTQWKPSIHMPRWACRETLRVLSVLPERLQDITEEDARADGAIFHDGRGVGHTGWRHDIDHGFAYANARSSFRAYWDSLNAKRGHPWESNPWVWRYELERVK